MVFSQQMTELRELLRSGDESVTLDIAALQIACLEYPDLVVDQYLVLLESYAREFSERLPSHAPTLHFVELLNDFLFEELGFSGNQDDYYAASNSCLNEVLASRVGIPITLSVVYMEIARRAGRRVQGIGLPGHFLVQVDEPDLHSFVDPFHGGEMLDAEECFELARQATALDLPDDPAYLEPVSKRQICLRILNNLRTAYFRAGATDKAVRVLDLLIEAVPDSAEEYKQRGVCFAHQKQFLRARADFETYLRLAPSAPDRQEVTAELQRIERILELMD
jgi:regulator of sirC expression with transglutaminase-like and TPR domain